jgi:hypothetical protein
MRHELCVFTVQRYFVVCGLSVPYPSTLSVVCLYHILLHYLWSVCTIYFYIICGLSVPYPSTLSVVYLYHNLLHYLWSVCTISFYMISLTILFSKIFAEDKIFVAIFSANFILNISHSKRNQATYMKIAVFM